MLFMHINIILFIVLKNIFFKMNPWTNPLRVGLDKHISSLYLIWPSQTRKYVGPYGVFPNGLNRPEFAALFIIR